MLDRRLKSSYSNDHLILLRDIVLITYSRIKWYTICLWSSPTADLDGSLRFLISRYIFIKFTLEVGGANINFLNLNISMAKGRHFFGIHRKATTVDTSIHDSSAVPFSQDSYTQFPCYSREAFLKEVIMIKDITKMNGLCLGVDHIDHRKMTSRAFRSATSLCSFSPF